MKNSSNPIERFCEGSKYEIYAMPKPSITNVLKSDRMIRGENGDYTDGKILFHEKFVPESFKSRFEKLRGDSDTIVNTERVIPEVSDNCLKLRIFLRDGKKRYAVLTSSNDVVYLIPAEHYSYIIKNFPDAIFYASKDHVHTSGFRFSSVKRAIHIYKSGERIGVVMPVPYDTKLFYGLKWSDK